MKKQIFNIILIILCTAIMLLCLFMVDSPKAIAGAFLKADIRFLAGAIMCMIVYWAFEAGVVYSVCRTIKNDISYLSCFKVTMIGQLFNSITPSASGGQPMQIYSMSKLGASVGKSSCALISRFIVYQIVLTVYSAVAIVLRLGFFLEKVTGFTLLVFIGFIANTVVLALILGIGFAPKLTTKFLTGILNFLTKIKIVKKRDELEKKMLDEIDKFYVDFKLLKSTPKSFIVPFILTAFQLTAFFSVPYFVCMSLAGHPLNYVTVLCASAFVLLISSFVPLPGGSGGAEGSFFLFFGIFLATSAKLSAAILLWRIATFYLPIIVGLFFMIDRKKKDITAVNLQ